MLAGAGAVGVACEPELLAKDRQTANRNIKQSVCRWCFSEIPLEKLDEALVDVIEGHCTFPPIQLSIVLNLSCISSTIPTIRRRPTRRS